MDVIRSMPNVEKQTEYDVGKYMKWKKKNKRNRLNVCECEH